MRGRLESVTWTPEPGQASAGVVPIEIEAFVPDLLRDASSVPSSLLAHAAKVEARIDAMQQQADTIELEVVARMLLRAEAVSSSRIEGLVMGHRRLAQAAAGRHDVDARMVVDNVEAVRDAVDRARTGSDLNDDELCAIHARLVANDPRMRRDAGRLRRHQNWIGGAGATPARAEFVPPPVAELPRLLDDMYAYARRDDVLASLQAAAVHAQFETIHPFADGNGRVGRILIATQLARRGVATRIVPPISIALAADADRYVRGLTSWRFGDPTDWYEVFLGALEQSVVVIGLLRDRLSELRQQWFLDAGAPRRHSATALLLDHLASHPILDAGTAARLTDRSEVAARQALRRLSDAGIVRPFSAPGRRNSWEVVGLFAILDALENEFGSTDRAPRGTR